MKPIYHTIAAALRREIRAGAYPFQGLLPTEAALCERFSCSYAPVRRALALLAQEGYVQARQGRGVTVIWQPEQAGTQGYATGELDTFPEICAARGLTPKTRLLTFERLFADFISRDRYFELSLAQTLIKLCVDIARFKSNPDAALQGTDDRIDRVIARIHRSFDRELTVSELAAAEFISVGRLRTLFRERCGISPQKYIAALRINTAKQLLEQPGMTIAEVARSVGIPDALYFSRIFRQHTGLTPSEYRAMNLTE